jgi:hypothetical protein
VAAYLRAGVEETPAGEKMLEKLALPQTAREPAPAAAPIPGPRVDETKLEALAKPEPAAAPKKEPEQKPADLSKVDEKLSSLLGGKK